MVDQIPLVKGYYAVPQEQAEFRSFFSAHVKTVFGPNESIDLDKVLSADERTAMAKLRKRMGDPLRLYYGLFSSEGEQVGWSFGFQTDAECFYMCNTGILEAHRGQGLYTALLPAMVKDIAALGFQVIFSRHTVTNNAVLVPKLRAGFVISEMELSDRFGRNPSWGPLLAF